MKDRCRRKNSFRDWKPCRPIIPHTTSSRSASPRNALIADPSPIAAPTALNATHSLYIY